MRVSTISGKSIELVAATKVFASRSAGDVVALKETSFTIAAGEFVSVVGPSGCGKSTVMRIIAGLTALSGGSALIGGESIDGPSREVGIAFQKPVLLPWLNIRRNIALPAELEGQWTTAEKDRRIDELLKMVRLEGLGDRFPNELSGGMQQRVAIARSLIRAPSIVLMDEPFGALDALTREHLNDELLTIWRNGYPTVLFITHDVAEAVYLSDRIIVMAAKPGRVVADVKVNLPGERTPEVRGSSEFGRLGAHIRDLISH